MGEYLQLVIDWVAQHSLWAGWLVFLVAFAESVAILGLLVPGVVLMFGFGALIANGALTFWPVFGWAVAGAVAGDSLSFWLGHRYQTHLYQLWPFRRHPRSLQQGVHFFERYGGKSVAFGRFFGPVRAVIPLVAGMLKMPPWRFLIANLLSALVWAPAYLLPGIVFGASLELASEVAFRLVAWLLIFAAALWIVLIVSRGIFRLLQPHTSRIVQALLQWGRAHRGFAEIAAALGDPDHPESRGLAILASLLLLSTLLFLLLSGLITSGGLFDGPDLAIHSALQSLRTPWADSLMVYLTRLGDLPLILGFALAVAALLALQGNWRALGYWGAALGFGLLMPMLLKYGLRVPRPEPRIEGLSPWAFPSAHVLRSLTLYGFFAVMIARTLYREWRWIPYSLVTLLVFAVALSRLYLGVHWLSDIIGSLLLGLAWISALGLAYHRHLAAETHANRFMFASALALSTLFAIDSWQNHSEKLQRYQPLPATEVISQAEWLADDGSLIPRQRHDIRARLDHPLNLQLIGDPAQLLDQLQAQGWRPATRLDWGNALQLLSPSLPLQQLPLLPQVHDGRHESISWERPLPEGGRLVLRLWSSHFRVAPDDRPLWIGNVSQQIRPDLAGLLSLPQTDSDFLNPLRILEQDLGPIKALESHRNEALLRLILPNTHRTPSQ
ncbi:bifunctional DedA family/phosphatase PAP2 family protein [Candidatus Endoriftia persephone]|jgi:undecaprenyl-diphosphatase|uniref:Phosphoesterase PA-phosphatase-like protein n=3 Tax=Gammaproteobacteria TaxID=1236 RepID=G2FGV3_9GAMM|nr:bifunctional DedA family/phosphatase PAP2 family protein [Candidatus Endoriftia persephone]EGV51323.1 PA-phosphatase-like phosphoesterase [endosymbiont of Riftia pachyptila (vent Ph05)]EGW53922.1 phosphoesterase PA-phosphatase-like protein [endosymbiont of Tevnia jerichonana (vent Tica)]USF87353.1 VTT domain-containing protein [Candidatus Endoriftia persephone]